MAVFAFILLVRCVRHSLSNQQGWVMVEAGEAYERILVADLQHVIDFLRLLRGKMLRCWRSHQPGLSL